MGLFQNRCIHGVLGRTIVYELPYLLKQFAMVLLLLELETFALEQLLLELKRH